MNRPRLACATALLMLTACATAQEPPAGHAPSAQIDGTLLIGGTEYDVAWGRPEGAAVGLAVIQHGFTRRCDNLRGTLDALVARGLLTLCVNAPMAGGNPALADALADTLVAGVATPWGEPVPQAVVVGGHSAGGAFAARLGGTLALIAPQRLAGALFFDPVAAASFSDDLRGLSGAGQRPVRTVSANASGCNAFQNAYPALQAVLDDAVAAGNEAFVGLQLADRSTHVDAEGADTDPLGWVACRQGPPRSANVTTLRDLASVWAADMALGVRTPDYYPGGKVLERLRSRGRALLIE